MMTMWCLELLSISVGSTYSENIMRTTIRKAIVIKTTATFSDSSSTATSSRFSEPSEKEDLNFFIYKAKGF